jgi:hypothetical protein
LAVCLRGVTLTPGKLAVEGSDALDWGEGALWLGLTLLARPNILEIQVGPIGVSTASMRVNRT